MPTDHEAIDKVVTSQGAYGTGVTPNPYAERDPTLAYRKQNAEARELLTKKIISLIEPRFTTALHTSECIEAIVAMSGARKILEVGMHVGFTTLHMLRAVVGRTGAKVVSVDARPALDREFFARFPEFVFAEGWSPAILAEPVVTDHAPFDVIFVDSQHDVATTQAEFEAIKNLVRSGTVMMFHDVPAWQTPDNHKPHPARVWLEGIFQNGELRGCILPTTEQMDCTDTFGEGYDPRLNPHLGVGVVP